jgi:hypothetical protein
VVATDIAAPFIWAGAAVAIGGVATLLISGTRAGIGDVVDAKLKPLWSRIKHHDRTLKHHDHRLTEVERHIKQEPLHIVRPADETGDQ